MTDDTGMVPHAESDAQRAKGGNPFTRAPRLGPGLVLVAVAVAFLSIPSTSSAYQEIRGDKGHPDPCTKAGVGDDGGAAFRSYTDPNTNKVTVSLLCSPKKGFPSGTVGKFVDDWTGFTTFSGIGGGAGGDPAVLPSYLHGSIADALRLADFKAWPAIKTALVSAGVTFGSSLALSLIVCAAGGIETLGLTCVAAAAAVAVATLRAIVAGVGAATISWVTAQLNRYSAAADAKWFVWMEKWGMFWTSVAGVSDTAFNPSLGNARIGKEAKARVGVQFTSAPAGGGPDFFDIKSDGTLTAKGKAAAASSARSAAGIPADIGRQIDTLNFNRGPLGIDPGGRHRVRSGTRKSERLRGGGGDDTLQGFRGRDRLYGRGGDDSMLGGKGKDVLLAGPGTDYLNGGGGNDRLVAPRGTNTLIGGGGSDSLGGGRGSDTLVDWDGRTIVRTGRTKRRQRDFVNVRDGDGDDVVICRSKRSTVIVDRRDRVRGRCGKVIRRGRIFRAKKR